MFVWTVELVRKLLIDWNTIFEYLIVGIDMSQRISPAISHCL